MNTTRPAPKVIENRENQRLRLLLAAATPTERLMVMDWYRHPPADSREFYRAKLLVRSR